MHRDFGFLICTYLLLEIIWQFGISLFWVTDLTFLERIAFYKF